MRQNQWEAVHGLSAEMGRYAYMADVASLDPVRARAWRGGPENTALRTAGAFTALGLAFYAPTALQSRSEPSALPRSRNRPQATEFLKVPR